MDTEIYKNLLLFAQPVELYGLTLKQFTVGELLDKFETFNHMRNLVYCMNKDAISVKFKKDIDLYMFDVKELLLTEYGYVGYDIDYDAFDLVCYHPEYNAMFVAFLNYFTHDNILSAIHMPELDRLNITYNDVKIYQLTRDEFKFMLNVFCLLNYANEIDGADFRVEKSKEAIDFDERKKAIKDKHGFKDKPTMTFNSILSWLVNDGYTHETLINKTIFQVMDSFKRKNHMGYCKKMNNAISNGLCSDMKESELKKINNALCLY